MIEDHPIEIVVSLHSNDNKYPMNPMDFVKLSRFRKNIESGPDKGYNKVRHNFEENNRHDPCYFNIQISIKNDYYVKANGHVLKNKRPLDRNRYQDTYFLQPFNKLCGGININVCGCRQSELCGYFFSFMPSCEGIWNSNPSIPGLSE